MPSLATLNFVGTRLPLHLTLKKWYFPHPTSPSYECTKTYPLSLLNNWLSVYPLLPLWIVFALYLPLPSQFQPTVRQIGADKGFLLQTWLLWKHHPLSGSEWSNLKNVSLTCLTSVSIKDTCNILFAWWSHFTTMTRIFEFAFLCKLGLLIFKPHLEHQVKI